jgi:dolichol-phosphate mannosyltransferase
MKLSIVIPVYYNQDNLMPLYRDMQEKVLTKIDYDYEIVFVNDGSKDNSLEVLKQLADMDRKIKVISLSRNFGSHAAILCGLSHCTGDCAVVKAADLQEPSELILEMVSSWKKGNNVVLAVRSGRDESKSQTLFASLYYWLVRKTALPTMPKGGFDVYLLDRKVIRVLSELDETNSALTGQILWSGFKTDVVYYRRLAREIGESKWTLRKKIRLVMDTLFSFSTLPISVVLGIGAFSFIGATVWSIVVLVCKLMGLIQVSGWTTLFIFNLFSFAIIMMTLGVLGEYLWRTFDASRNRPPYIVEERISSENAASEDVRKTETQNTEGEVR